jgi:integrase-like protein
MYLVGTLNLHDMTAQVLHLDGDATDGDRNARFSNLEGMLAALHGDHGKARRMLREALLSAGDSPVMQAKIFANLAEVSIRSGMAEEAEAWVHAYTAARAGSAAANVLMASVGVDIASTEGNPPALRAAAESFTKAAATRMAELDEEDPRALSLVASFARTRILVAKAEHSAADLDRATSVLEMAVFRLAAELGADDPRTAAAKAALDSASDPVPAAGTVIYRNYQAATMPRDSSPRADETPQSLPRRHSLKRIPAHKDGMVEYTAHELRHACASLLIASGATDMQVCYQMGHGKVETTKDIYGHLFAQDQEFILEAMNHAISRLYIQDEEDGNVSQAA